MSTTPNKQCFKNINDIKYIIITNKTNKTTLIF